MTDFAPWQWAGMVLAALIAGLSKGGVVGLGILVAAVMANVLPARQASGFVLPLLIVGDFAGIGMFRRHAQWPQLWRLLPWTVAGVVFGYLALGRIDDRQAQLLIGAIVLVLVVLHLGWKRWAPQGDAAATRAGWLAPAAGVLAGFTTLVANAAGPVMIIYLLARRMPKLEFLGTSAWFFLVLNLFKVPFMAHLGLIDGASLRVNLLLVPVVLLGAQAGRWLVRRLDQRKFELVALGLTIVAGVKLLLG
jgi:hypothetical protein